ncbi:SGNH/GDSL hydrolase family protein [Gynuella sp.]|uniref:SGNH/GDSL hydrolase family protein n=1 Tax=Gynuella sp. TaxID=2969146 RepID=UPI003D0A04F5
MKTLPSENLRRENKKVSICARYIVLLIVSSLISACDGIGSLVSNTTVSEADNNQVITIGDSIFALSGELQDNLESYAGETFRRYTLSGAELSGGNIATSIEDQYHNARQDNSDIDLVLMDGGGNDILIPAIMLDPYNCKTQWYDFGRLSQRCMEQLDDIYVETVNLLNQMYVDDVKSVVFLGYYYTKNALLLLDSMEEAIDYGDTRLSQACDFSVVSCTFIDPRTVINDNDIILDGIHPSHSGSRKLADLTWPVLKQLL